MHMSAKLFIISLKFKNNMKNRYFKIPQISRFGGIVRLLEDKTGSVCRSNFEGRNCFSTLEINMPTCTLHFIKTWSRPIKYGVQKKTYKQARFIS